MSASKADKWVPCKPGGEGALALALAAALLKKKGGALSGDVAAVNQLLAGVNSAQLVSQAGVDSHDFEMLVEKLDKAHHAIALPPGVSAVSSNGTSDAAAVLLLNVLLGGLDSDNDTAS